MRPGESPVDTNPYCEPVTQQGRVFLPAIEQEFFMGATRQSPSNFRVEQSVAGPAKGK
jgi:hypothetical protein